MVSTGAKSRVDVGARNATRSSLATPSQRVEGTPSQRVLVGKPGGWAYRWPRPVRGQAPGASASAAVTGPSWPRAGFSA